MPIDINMGGDIEQWPTLPEGVYEAKLTNAVFKKSKNNAANLVLHCKWEVVTPEKTWSLLSWPVYGANTLWNFQRFLKAIAPQGDWDQNDLSFDEADVIGDSCYILVAKELDNKDVMRNQVKDYFAEPPEDEDYVALSGEEPF